MTYMKNSNLLFLHPRIKKNYTNIENTTLPNIPLKKKIKNEINK